ncbi:hypothetical protein Pla123a_01460 [Posidoniimonas polymericola]|uniref:TIGR02117 family protein n=1 Tax=Posidoniimonas polymericola TaxID=2528002 RepID=A0A5C5ZD54_9BACT|nr:TIGR02117 family protein [Posidoniimonas polymericola]TWT85339.1 hypothetical protein Pla123a_01460 [Posidoniimonas polymericola]
MPEEPQTDSRRRFLRRLRRWLVRGVLAVVGFVAFYALFLLVGLIQVNRGYAPPADGIEVFVQSDAVHTDLILPIQNGQWDWSELLPAADFPEEPAWATHYAIGWGDRGFYLDTPTWADLKASTAVVAMFWPSRTVMHVSACTAPGREQTSARVVLTPEQYRTLCESIADSFAGDHTEQIDFSYGRYDAFYQATGAYHCFYTCNSWAGAKLRAAGVATPLFTPLPGQVGMYLE